MIKHLTSTLTRLEEVLDTSIDAMVGGGPVDDAAAASTKGRALLALARLSADVDAASLPQEARAAIKRVREKLERERTLLEHRLQASEVVIKLIGDAILADRSDGTYGPMAAHPVTAARP